MPTPIVAGNWKMNTTIEEAADLASAMVDCLDAVAGIEKVICPPFVSLAAVAEVLQSSTVALGAQSMYHEAEGAFTGEVSPTMLAPVCRFVILGHSERRQLFGETDDLVSLKVQAARRFGLRPIVCVGEHLKEREAGRAEQVVEDQIRASLRGVTDSAGLVLAYEPVWAIGTGMAATPEIAGAMMSRIRAVLTSLYGAARASDVPLLYGGSVNPRQRRRLHGADRCQRRSGRWGQPRTGVVRRHRKIGRRRFRIEHTLVPRGVENRLLAVVGPTGVGKSAFALRASKELGGEIVNADSRQVYRRLDVGTAKPTLAERASVPHHLFDVVDPHETYSLAQFLTQATAAIADIHSRSKLPVLAGGTGQYVRALLEGWKAPAVEPDPETRRTLEERARTFGVASLIEELAEIDPEAAEKVDGRNVRRVVRALEVAYSGMSNVVRKEPPPYDVVLIGLTLDRRVLYERIDSRVDAMIAAGWLSEVEGLLADGCGPDLPSMSSVGYSELADVLAGVLSMDEAVQRIKVQDAPAGPRAQYAWFRPADDRIRWFDAASETPQALSAVRDWVASMPRAS